MAYATTVSATPHLRAPRVTIPRFRPPRLSQRTRALVMMGIMISPAFLADDIGYCVERLFLTADQVAARQAAPTTDAIPAGVYVFHVACTDAEAPAAERV